MTDRTWKKRIRDFLNRSNLKCDTCKKPIERIAVLNPILISDNRKLCLKCAHTWRTDKDRTGRHSKKDKFKDKNTRCAFH